jgi:CheY-like chemotaxis protein
MLEKRGHAVIVVENGKEAVAAIASQGERPFDLVLMDVQMPEMDGFEATSSIREREKSSGVHIPIIALTAHAMEGDRKNCLAAGMDSFIAKPLKGEDLLAVIEMVINFPSEITREVRSERKVEEGVFDPHEALERMNGDRDLFREVVGIFAGESSKLLAEIRDAISAGDLVRLNCAAHNLKGTVGNFGARDAFEAALKLEMLEELEDAPVIYNVLEKEIERLQRSLAEFIS